MGVFSRNQNIIEAWVWGLLTLEETRAYFPTIYLMKKHMWKVVGQNSQYSCS